MAVMIRSVVAAAMTLVRRTRWMMGRWTVMTVVAAGEQSAHCEKGDSSCKLLSILPCEHISLLSFEPTYSSWLYHTEGKLEDAERRIKMP